MRPFSSSSPHFSLLPLSLLFLEPHPTQNLSVSFFNEFDFGCCVVVIVRGEGRLNAWKSEGGRVRYVFGMVASFLWHHHTDYDLNAQSREKGAWLLELDWFNSQCLCVLIKESVFSKNEIDSYTNKKMCKLAFNK